MRKIILGFWILLVSCILIIGCGKAELEKTQAELQKTQAELQIVSCNSKPSETDGCLALEKEYFGCKIVSFKKTNGQKVEFMGAEGYKMEYEAKIELDYNHDYIEELNGIILFEKTENGWRVMSDGIKPDPREREKRFESVAIASLQVLCSSEAVWRQGDLDGNGIKDYWTYDLSSFNRMYYADGATKFNWIDMSFARADANRAVDGVFGESPSFENWDTGPTRLAPAPKSGYFFRAMLKDERGMNYNINTVGTNNIPAANSSKFAFVSYPYRYGKTFIVNQTGTVYSKNLGDNKIILEWPRNLSREEWQKEE